MTINFVDRGVLSLCFLFAVMLAAGGEGNGRLKTGERLFAVWSVGALLLAAFPTDVPPVPVSWHGAIHLVVAVFAFLGGAFGALYISRWLVGNRAAGMARGIALPLSYLAVLLCAIDLLSPFVAPGFSAHYGGLTERLFLGSVLLWIALLSAVMVRGQKPALVPPP